MKKFTSLVALMAALSLAGTAVFVGCSSGGDSPTGSANRAIIRDPGGTPVANGEIRLPSQGNQVIGSTTPDGEVVLTASLPVGYYRVEVYVGGQLVTEAVIEVEDDGSLELDDAFEDSDEIDSDSEESDDANSAIDSVEDNVSGGGGSPGEDSVDDDESADD